MSKGIAGLDCSIGVIYVSSSKILEWEWQRILPDNISFHVARLLLHEGTSDADSLWEMIRDDRIAEEARKLATAEVDVITLACTTGSFIGGKGWDEKIARVIEEASGGIPASTTSTGLVAALRHLGCRRVTVVTPYIDEINELEKRFLVDNGFEVPAIRGLGCIKDQDIGRVTTEQFVELAHAIHDPASDCLFISCTNSRTVEAIAVLEASLDKPVLSSNQVTLWHALRTAGQDTSVIQGYGRLFSAQVPASGPLPRGERPAP